MNSDGGNDLDLDYVFLFEEEEEEALANNDPTSMISIQRRKDVLFNSEDARVERPHRCYLRTRARITASLWFSLYGLELLHTPNK